MAERIIIKIPGDFDPNKEAPVEFEWRSLNGSGEWEAEQEFSSLEQLQGDSLKEGAEVWLMISGARVSSRTLPISAAERRHMQSLLPFQLEDDVACDVESLHFAFGTPKDGDVTMAYLDKQWFADTLHLFSEEGISINGCIPEPLLLPCDEKTCTLSLGSELLVRNGKGAAFSLDDSLADIGLKQLEEMEPMAESFTLIAPSDEALARLEEQMPEALREKVGQRYVRDFWGAFNVSSGTATLGVPAEWLNLCAGAFGRRLPILAWWGLWRKLAYFSLFVLAVFILTNVLEVQQLKSQQGVMQQDIEKAFRSVVPRGAMVDASRQLKAKMKSQQNVSQGSDALVFMSFVSPLLQAAPKVKLLGFQYNHDRNEMRLNVQAPSFNNIESVRNQLDKDGFQSTLMSSSAQGGVHSARIKIEKLSQ